MAQLTANGSSQELVPSLHSAACSVLNTRSTDSIVQAHVYPSTPSPPWLRQPQCLCFPLQEALDAVAASVSTDWSHSGDEHAAAYTRAGLPHWAAQCLSEPGSPTDAASQPIQSASQPAGPASQAAAAPVLADRPSAVVQATICDVLLTLPHDQDFGRAERFVELWSKAFGQVESQQRLTSLLLLRWTQHALHCTLLHDQQPTFLHHQYFPLLHHQYFVLLHHQ